MLQLMRNNLNSWITKVIIGVICFAFTVWGLETLMMPDQTGTKTITLVNNESITQQQYQRVLQSVQHQFAQKKQNLSPDKMHQLTMKELINQTILIDFAKKNDLMISDNEVDQKISKIEAFQENGRFKRENYIDVLRRAGYTPASFRDNLKRDLLVEQVQSALTQSFFITDNQLDYFLKLENQKRNVQWTILDTAKHRKNQSISSIEIESFYQKNQNQFMTPEKVSVGYIVLRRTDLMNKIVVSDSDIETAYQSYVQSAKDKFKPEYRKIELNFTDVTKESQMKLANKLIQELQKGGSFETLAKQHSNDKKTADKKGYIGPFNVDQYPDVVKNAVEKLKPNQLSELIVSEEKIFIFDRMDAGHPVIASLESKRHDLVKDIKITASIALFEKKSQLMADLSFESMTLEDPAKQLNLKIQNTAFFTKKGEGVGVTQHAGFIQAAFTEDVIQGRNSDLIILSPDQEIAVLHLKQHQVSYQKTITEVNSEIKNNLLKEKTKQSLIEESNQIILHLKQGKSFDELDRIQKLSWQIKNKVSRHEKDVPDGVLETVFKMPNPNQSKSRSVARAMLPNEEIAVVVLNDIILDIEEKSEEGLKNLFRFALGRTQGELDYKDWLAVLNKKAKIEHKIKMDSL
ncbi:MAG: hypothetical protein HAW62_01655 [Endozoicomonadaceae bacterium]|nr:hypothetical protein [Endozoicomonadaceae bacterium]